MALWPCEQGKHSANLPNDTQVRKTLWWLWRAKKQQKVEVGWIKSQILNTRSRCLFPVSYRQSTLSSLKISILIEMLTFPWNLSKMFMLLNLTTWIYQIRLSDIHHKKTLCCMRRPHFVVEFVICVFQLAPFWNVKLPAIITEIITTIRAKSKLKQNPWICQSGRMFLFKYPLVSVVNNSYFHVRAVHVGVTVC